MQPGRVSRLTIATIALSDRTPWRGDPGSVGETSSFLVAMDSLP